MSDKIAVTFTVNGRSRRVSAPPMKRLLDVLREECGLTGTKEGCGEGECGACSLLLDGKSVNSCLVPVAHAAGRRVTTVEGLARGAKLNALQAAFVDMGGAQCGICTPGMLVTASELLARAKGRVPSDAEVRDALAGNLCRCTGYQKIVDAVQAAARVGVQASRAKTGGAKATRGAKRKRAAKPPTAHAKKMAARATTKRRVTARRAKSKHSARRLKSR
ncbi:MAG TPA: 2Fe-2S iron-sulfur cluster-binding protein [Candidatus Saccharimonadaceae bacterium]|nr:2Fe-2S iron-sulfur cluster-binding protein [Candidatus Saccharimonadaceae bacterium]